MTNLRADESVIPARALPRRFLCFFSLTPITPPSKVRAGCHNLTFYHHNYLLTALRPTYPSEYCSQVPSINRKVSFLYMKIFEKIFIADPIRQQLISATSHYYPSEYFSYLKQLYLTKLRKKSEKIRKNQKKIYFS